MIQMAICDDNAQERCQLRAMLQNCGISLRITEYESGETLLWDVETEQKQFDLYLLDIYLKGLNGVEAARRIRTIDDNAILIFISVSEDFYREAFDVYAFNYLLKPIEQTALNMVLEKATQDLHQRREKILQITFRGRTYLLRHDDIEYIASYNRTLSFHLHDGSERTCYGKLNEIMEQLEPTIFTRCHQSYIVNLRYVLERIPEGFRMADVIIPISRSYSDKAQEALNQYLFGVFEEI